MSRDGVMVSGATMKRMLLVLALQACGLHPEYVCETTTLDNKTYVVEMTGEYCYAPRGTKRCSPKPGGYCVAMRPNMFDEYAHTKEAFRDIAEQAYQEWLLKLNIGRSIGL